MTVSVVQQMQRVTIVGGNTLELSSPGPQGSAGAGGSLVWRPGGSDGNDVFASFSDVYAAGALVSGVKDVWLDSTSSNTFTFPTGTSWDLSRYRFWSFTEALTILVDSATTTWTGFPMSLDAWLKNTGTSGNLYTSATFRTVELPKNGVLWQSGAGGRIVRVTGSTFVVSMRGSSGTLGNSTSPVIYGETGTSAYFQFNGPRAVCLGNDFGGPGAPYFWRGSGSVNTKLVQPQAGGTIHNAETDMRYLHFGGTVQPTAGTVNFWLPHGGTPDAASVDATSYSGQVVGASVGSIRKLIRLALFSYGDASLADLTATVYYQSDGVSMTSTPLVTTVTHTGTPNFYVDSQTYANETSIGAVHSSQHVVGVLCTVVAGGTGSPFKLAGYVGFE